jgi:hypothetical protein
LLTEKDIHAFLLDTAKFLGEKPIEMYGPGIRFRWLIGDRIVEIRTGTRGGRRTLTVRSFDRKLIMDTYEYSSLNHWMPDLCPPLHLWSALLSPAPNAWWWPGSPVITTWDFFEITIGRMLQHLPTDIALTPPKWRVGLAYLWNIGAAPSGFGGVSVSGERDGLGIYIGAVEMNLLIPRTHLDAGLVNVTDVIAGMSPNHLLSEVGHFDVEGFDSCPVTPGYDDSQATGAPRPGITLDELRAIIATEVPTATPSPVPPLGTIPPQIVLTIPQAIDAVVDAVTHERFETIQVSKSPQVGVDSLQVIDYARQLCDALTDRFGFPIGLATGSDHQFMRIFQVGDVGVQVTNSCDEVKVVIDRLYTILSQTYC